MMEIQIRKHLSDLNTKQMQLLIAGLGFGLIIVLILFFQTSEEEAIKKTAKPKSLITSITKRSQ